jgi:hypothetical protein
VSGSVILGIKSESFQINLLIGFGWMGLEPGSTKAGLEPAWGMWAGLKSRCIETDLELGWLAS